MTDKELRKLSRRDLLELMVRQEKQNEKLRERVSKLENRLQERAVIVEKAGTMAEAALMLNDIFERADKAAAQYLESIKAGSEQQQATYDRIVSLAEEKAKEIIESAEKEKRRKIREADAWAEYMRKRTDELRQSTAFTGEVAGEPDRQKDGND